MGISQTNLIGEYRFDEGGGSTLTDYSGVSGNGALGLSGGYLPTWSAKGLTFANSLVQMPVALAAAKTIQFLLTAPLSSGNDQSLFGTDAGTNVFLTANDNRVLSVGTSGIPVTGSSDQIVGTHAIQITFGSPNRIWIDGVEATYFTQGNSAFSLSASSSFWLGHYVGAAQDLTNVTVHHGSFYNAVLSNATVTANFAQMVSQVAGRGVTVSPRYLPQCIFDGDSRTYGVGSTFTVSPGPTAGSYPHQLMLYLPSTPYAAMGIGGETAAAMLAAFDTRIKPILNASPSRVKVVVCAGGHNDLYGGATAAATYATLQAYAAKCRAIGAKCIVPTVPPSNVVANPAALNTLIRAGVGTDFDACPDLIADVRLATYTNTTYFAGDQIHFTDAGYAAWAQIVGQQGLARVMASIAAASSAGGGAGSPIFAPGGF